MKTMEVRLNVNGEAKQWTIAPGDLLLDVLRREGYFGVKRGCEAGECGACTVLLGGQPINSCLMFAAQAEGACDPAAPWRSGSWRECRIHTAPRHGPEKPPGADGGCRRGPHPRW